MMKLTKKKKKPIANAAWFQIQCKHSPDLTELDSGQMRYTVVATASEISSTNTQDGIN